MTTSIVIFVIVLVLAVGIAVFAYSSGIALGKFKDFLGKKPMPILALGLLTVFFIGGFLYFAALDKMERVQQENIEKYVLPNIQEAMSRNQK